ncbi:MAG TPA: AAA family ATPase, partial [Thermoleophilia bacterium]|nr:AAA family ATPase [Thermoleophilia bacterium]
MNLISEIEIEGFRSVREARLSDLGNFTAFAGLNNSGKSNLLRATHAFFTDYTDPEQLLSVDDDYYRPDLRKKKAKRIRVTVKFNLPSSFKFRKGLEPVSGFLGSSPFRITKEWRRLAPSASYFL